MPVKPKVTLTEKDLGWNALRQTIKVLKQTGTHVKVGVLDDGLGADDHGGLTTAMLAAIMNFGTDKIPARPWITGTFEKYRAKYLEQLTQLVRGIYEGRLNSFEDALEVMGALIANDMRREVTSGSNFESNAESTIKAKGSSRPLIDTARMIGAVAWAVVRSTP